VNRPHWVGKLCFLTLACIAVAQAPASQEDLNALLDGVAQIGAPGAPGTLCVFGEKAFGVVTGGAGRSIHAPLVAAARMGKGRVVAFGHDGYFGQGALAVADTGRLMLNAVRWAAGKHAPRVAVHGQPGLLAFLQKQKLHATALDGAGWREKLKGFDVLCVHPNHFSARERSEAVERFLRDGGGLVAGDTGWGWLQLHPGKTLQADHPGNRLLAPAGLVWSDGTLRRTSKVGFAAKPLPPELCHAGRALESLEAHAAGKAKLNKDQVAQASWVLSHAARSLPRGDKLLLPRLGRLQHDRTLATVPTPRKPLTMKNPLARVLLTLDLQELMRLPPDQVRAHPAAAAFPGAVPAKAERVHRELKINTSVPGWHSTGLYAAPGEVISVEVAPRAPGKKLTVRIGAHNDRLWHHSSWRRCPEVCRRYPIGKPLTRAANAFGGLVYIEVPGACKLGSISVRVSGAVEAPYYVLGKTELAQWRAKIRHRPAPWAELATDKVVLTLPSKAVRKLDDPEDLMKFWDRVLDACAELAARPLKRPRPERYVTDTQIGAGYMHSGYPIMTLLDMPAVMVDKARMLRNAHGGIWGLFHELGHNHQSRDWTFGGAGEVTVNLFTLYVYDKVLDRRPHTLRNFSQKARTKTLKAYLAKGPDFKQWQRRPFLALLMYIQLQEAFSWEAFKKVFAEYRGLPRGERPRNDDEKRDQWMVRFSRAVGRNLGPFFQAWGVPTSEKARASIADLPAWMPEGFPPR